MIKLLDLKLEKLKNNPARFPRDSNEKNQNYPIGWSEMLGKIFHKISYKYYLKIDRNLPKIDFSNYMNNERIK